jgi:hypothetical protein
LKNPNTIRTFLKAVRLECFVLNVLVSALRPIAVILSVSWLSQKPTLHRLAITDLSNSLDCRLAASWDGAQLRHAGFSRQDKANETKRGCHRSEKSG